MCLFDVVERRVLIERSLYKHLGVLHDSSSLSAYPRSRTGWTHQCSTSTQLRGEWLDPASTAESERLSPLHAAPSGCTQNSKKHGSWLRLAPNVSNHASASSGQPFSCACDHRRAPRRAC